ncbi:MAG: hypothetical protein GKS06_04155 [Acidobacteria bacterium]|nr:hypothetical protein [Acidobacteriota bacterium]
MKHAGFAGRRWAASAIVLITLTVSYSLGTIAHVQWRVFLPAYPGARPPVGVEAVLAAAKKPGAWDATIQYWSAQLASERWTTELLSSRSVELAATAQMAALAAVKARSTDPYPRLLAGRVIAQRALRPTARAHSVAGLRAAAIDHYQEAGALWPTSPTIARLVANDLVIYSRSDPAFTQAAVSALRSASALGISVRRSLMTLYESSVSRGEGQVTAIRLLESAVEPDARRAQSELVVYLGELASAAGPEFRPFIAERALGAARSAMVASNFGPAESATWLEGAGLGRADTSASLVSEVRSLSDLHSGSPGVWLLRGRVERDAGLTDEARRSLMRAARLAAGQLAAGLRLGDVSGDAAMRLGRLVAMLETDTSDWNILFTKRLQAPRAAVAVVAREMENLDVRDESWLVETALLAALAAPTNVGRLVLAGESLLRYREPARAAVIFRLALARDPGHEPAILGLEQARARISAGAGLR